MCIKQRKFDFCPSFEGYPLSRCIVRCPQCTKLFSICCFHKPIRGRVCHHYQLVFTDGACSNNGRGNATAGLGITMGEEYSWSVSVDDTIDPDAPRTNQRAELLAALEGLKKLHEFSIDNDPGDHAKLMRRHTKEDDPHYIVVTDSEYVVKGITEWLPSWRAKGWRTSGGKRPTNLDLFRKLDEYVSSLEQDHIVVGFLHVPREHNESADSLAKQATG